MDAVLDRFDAPPWVEAIAQSPLLGLALLAMLLAFAGSVLSRLLPRVGGLLRLGGNLALAGVLALTVLQLVRFANPQFDLALPQVGLPEQRVEGSETHVPMSSDGHFWVKAAVNGEQRRFLVDTGATLTAVSADLAGSTGIEPNPARMPVQLRTANGTMPGQLASIDELAFGNIVARDLDTVIAPGLGGMNVLGMNFLSRLKGWRVENGVLILVPHHPQPDSAVS
jgi:aspartyl protease family protein